MSRWLDTGLTTGVGVSDRVSRLTLVSECRSVGVSECRGSVRVVSGSGVEVSSQGSTALASGRIFGLYPVAHWPLLRGPYIPDPIMPYPVSHYPISHIPVSRIPYPGIMYPVSQYPVSRGIPKRVSRLPLSLDRGPLLHTHARRCTRNTSLRRAGTPRALPLPSKLQRAISSYLAGVSTPLAPPLPLG